MAGGPRPPPSPPPPPPPPRPEPSALPLRRDSTPWLTRRPQEHEGFGLAIVGHSRRRARIGPSSPLPQLGAGVAALLALLLREEDGLPALCYAFAPPACVSRSIVRDPKTLRP
eukprot:tig00000178_g12762.t1